MVNLKLYSPISRMMFRPMWQELDEEWPQMTMTEGLDVFEEDDRVVVKAAVPGIPAENVNVDFEDGVLRITARFEESEEEKKKKKVIYRQDRVMSFDYTATLPRAIDPATMEAEVEDGVVEITAKVAETAKKKSIPVKHTQKKLK